MDNYLKYVKVCENVEEFLKNLSFLLHIIQTISNFHQVALLLVTKEHFTSCLLKLKKSKIIIQKQKINSHFGQRIRGFLYINYHAKAWSDMHLYLDCNDFVQIFMPDAIHRGPPLMFCCAPLEEQFRLEKRLRPYLLSFL